MARRKRQKRKKRRSGAGLFLLAVFLLAAIISSGTAWLLLTPYGPESETFVDVAPGTSTTVIGRQLEQAGVVRSRFVFDLLRLWNRKTLLAGEYRFDRPATPIEVYARIARGDVFTKALVIPEGANIFDIATRVELAGLATRRQFLDAAVDQAALVADLDPGATSLEGYLFPDTYRFARNATADQIVAAMVRQFRVVAGQIGLTDDVHKVVTIASLVERETAVDEERPLIAGVFENRLGKNMPLMTDPAVIYGLQLEGRWRGAIYQSDLSRNTPYNTYLHPGLPPGPVSNPGVRSPRAAMYPARTDYLYFVAAGANAQGHSLFSTTFEEHQRNVTGYRRAVKKAGGR